MDSNANSTLPGDPGAADAVRPARGRGLAKTPAAPRLRPLCGLLLAVCTLALAAPMTIAHATDLGPLGDSPAGTGRSFRAECRPGDVIIGFNMRTGTLLDAIVPICISLPWGPGGPAYEPTQYWGGNGGGYQKIDCRPGYVVRHLHVFVDAAIRAHGRTISPAVNRIHMSCEQLDTGQWHDSIPARIAGKATADQRFSCPPSEWATGIFGRFNGLVASGGPAVIGALGLVCAPLLPRPVVNAPQPGPIVEAEPVPPPQPQAVTAVVQLPVDVYAAPGGQVIGVLAAGVTVTLPEPCRADNWCHVKGSTVPNGDGWVYSGPDYNSLGR